MPAVTISADYALRPLQFAELSRLKTLGMEKAEVLGRWAKGDLDDTEMRALAGMGGFAMEFVRISRAIRQLIVLEMELKGLREAPDRDAEPEEKLGTQERGDGERLVDSRDREDLYDRRDYDNGPLDRVIAGVRKALRVDPPENDPFAPPPKPKPRTEKPDETAQPVAAAPVKAAARPVMRPRNETAAIQAGILHPAAISHAGQQTGMTLRSRGPPR